MTEERLREIERNLQGPPSVGWALELIAEVRRLQQRVEELEAAKVAERKERQAFAYLEWQRERKMRGM